MSASTPPTSGDRAIADCDRRAGAERRFWLVSLILHVIVLGLVILLTPVREFVFDRDRPEKSPVITRGQDLDQVMEQIRLQTADRIRARVSVLNSGQERMARNYEIFQSHYRPFFEDQLDSAMARFEDHAAQTLESLATMNRHLRRAAEEEDFSGLVDEGSALQSRISASQRELRRGIVLLGVDAEELLAEQAELEEAQWELGPRLRRIQGDAGFVTSAPERMSELRAELAEREAKVAEEEEKVAQRKANVANVQAEHQGARDELEKLKAVVDAGDADQDRLREARERMEELERYLEHDGRGREVRRAEAGVERAERDLSGPVNRRDNVLEQVERLQSQIAERSARLESALAEVLEVQTRLHERQRGMIEQARALVQERTSEAEAEESS